MTIDSDLVSTDVPPSLPSVQNSLEDAKRFLDFLGDTYYTVAFLDREGREPIRGYGVVNGTTEEILEVADWLSRDYGATLHVTLNRTNDAGRKRGDIVASRVLCVDIDTPLSYEESVHLVSHYAAYAVVCSSPGKYHLYWPIEPGIDLDTWSHHQLGIAEMLGGDLKLAEINKTIRVPGFVRETKSGELFVPPFLTGPKSYQPPLSLAAVRELFPNVDDWAEAAAARLKAERQKLREEYRRVAVDFRAGRTVDAGTFGAGQGRNSALYEIVKREVGNLKRAEITEEDAVLLGQSVNSGFAEALGEDEVDKTARSAWWHGIELRAHRMQKRAELEAQLGGAGGEADGVVTWIEHVGGQSTVLSPAPGGHNTSYTNGAATNGVGTNGHGHTVQAELLATPAEAPLQARVPKEYGGTGGYTIDYAVSDECAVSILPPPGGAVGEAGAIEGEVLGKETVIETPAGEVTIPKDIDISLVLWTPFRYDYTEQHLEINRFTDMASVMRMIQRFGDLMIRVEGRFYAFDGSEGVWRVQTAELCAEVQAMWAIIMVDILRDPHFVHEMCVNEEGAVSVTKTKAAQKGFTSVRWGKAICSATMNCNQVRTDTPQVFDSNVDLVYFANGVVDMRTGDFRRARPTDYLLARSRVRYEPGATWGAWESFLYEVFQAAENPAAMVTFMQELFGYSLSGAINEQKIFCHHGAGSNGKSKVLAALAHVAGSYATFVPPDEMTSQFGRANKDFEKVGAKVEGRRVVIADDLEVPPNAKWNEAFVKNLTSPVLRARAEYQQSRMFDNHATIHLGLNEVPAPQSSNFGLLRRICIIEYGTKFAPSVDTSDQIDSMIRSSAAGIFNWAMEGYRRCIDRSRGIGYPEEVQLQIEEYQTEHFSLDNTIREMFTTGEKNEEVFTFLDEITDHVNKRLVMTGLGGTKASTASVSSSIMQIFQLKKVKRWHASRGNSFGGYQIKLKNVVNPLL